MLNHRVKSVVNFVELLLATVSYRALEMSFEIFVFMISIHTVYSVVITQDSESYVKEVIKEFEAAPTSYRYTSIILPPFTDHQEVAEIHSIKLLLKIFIWCPISQRNCMIKCPVHDEVLTVSFLTDILSKKSPRNPRLIFDVGENAVFVQRYYQCKKGHRYFYLATPS